MRSKALYHLLLDRARHLRVHGSAGLNEFLEEVEDSLESDFENGVYTISWRYRNDIRSIRRPSDIFTFYVPGDLDREQRLRGVREKNWLAALEIWREIVALSGGDWPAIAASGSTSMGLNLAAPQKGPSRRLVAHFAAMGIGGALAAFTIGAFEARPYDAVASIVCGLILAFFARQRDGLRKAPWPKAASDWAILLLAVITPAYFAHNGLPFLAAVLLALAILQVIERFAPSSWLGWVLAFSGLALALGAARSLGLSVGMMVFASVWLILTVLLPGRVNKAGVVIGCLLVLVGAAYGISTSTVSETPMIVVGLVLIFAILFGAGWFIGELFVLGPWLIHGALGFIALASLVCGDGQIAGAVTVATGFALVEFVRMISAFRGTKAKPIVMH